MQSGNEAVRAVGAGSRGKKTTTISLIQATIDEKERVIYLSAGEDIWLYSKVFVAPHLARATHASLYFIDDHQCAGLVTDFTYTFEEFLGCRSDASLS